MLADQPLAPSPCREGGGRLTERALDDLLVWMVGEEGSDLRLETGKRIILQRHGRVLKIGDRALTQREVEDAANRLYGSDGVARLMGGEDFDVAYEVADPNRIGRNRYRGHAKASMVDGRDAVSLVIRHLLTVPPPLHRQHVEPDIMAHYRPHHGLVLVAGGTGEGKSTLLAGMIDAKLADPDSNRIILEFARPIEYTYDHRDGVSSEITQVEIGRHLPSFSAGIRSAMRSAADDIVVGECRDAETMVATIEAALSNHAVYTTIHAGDPFQTIQRAVSLCPVDQRAAMTVSLAQVLRLIVNQRLVPSVDGRRTPIRAFLTVDAATRRRLAGTDPARWPDLVEALTQERGTTFAHSIRRALAQGRITGDVAARIAQEVSPDALA